MKRLAVIASLGAIYFAVGCENISNSMPTSPSLLLSGVHDTNNPIARTTEVLGDLTSHGTAQVPIPRIVNGVELMSVRGWFANIYPWDYIPSISTVHPVPRLWTAGRQPSPFQVSEQCRQIKEYGGGAAVLEYSPNPALGWHNYWLTNGFASECGPFFVLYENVNGTRFHHPQDGPIDMSDPYNRVTFEEDIDFIFRNVVLSNQGRYITVEGKAVIYLWDTQSMVGDFAGLLEEIKIKYPVLFLSGNESIPSTQEGFNRVKALDGIMDYTLGGSSDSYAETVWGYNGRFNEWAKFIREYNKRLLLIPTFQAAYDDSNFPGRTTSEFYANNREEVKNHARMIKNQMGRNFDAVGPFVVYSELPEGAAVIESQCLPETADRPGRWVGCGTARLEILKECFGSFPLNCGTR